MNSNLFKNPELSEKMCELIAQTKSYMGKSILGELITYSTNLDADCEILFSTPGFEKLILNYETNNFPKLTENCNIQKFVNDIYSFFPTTYCKKDGKYYMLTFNPEHISGLWHMWNKSFGYNVLNNNLINQIKNFINKDKVLSIMAGNGLLEYILLKNKVDIKITDNNSWEIKPYSQFIPIINCEYSNAIKQFSANVLLVSWIPYNLNVCDIFDLFKGNKMIILGEYEGCCANDKFFEKLRQNFDVEYVEVDNLPATHNILLLCKRKIDNKRIEELWTDKINESEYIDSEWIQYSRK
jgi:hypothetical protein